MSKNMTEVIAFWNWTSISQAVDTIDGTSLDTYPDTVQETNAAHVWSVPISILIILSVTVPSVTLLCIMCRYCVQQNN